MLLLGHIYAYISRYHGKCLKIARGKVKGSETFTCPICDWRVKIPRDAARPKLEDLQQWAEELATLPFQPDEEDILERIIDKAQSFRDFLQQYVNGNQICRTSEEMPTILFYLRKIEGAEVLLAYETNIFRQDVHKWQPIAPEAPPILEQSLSTRKPRPTKQQKMMKELGVQKIEDLPPHMRKQQTVKRKNTEPHIGRPAPPPLQPAQMQHQGSGPGSHSQMMRSDTPLGMPRPGSTGNAPPHNGAGFDAGSLSFGHGGFGTSAASSSYQSPHHAASPAMFSPTASLPSNSGMRESLLGTGFASGAIVVSGAGGAGADISPALFSPGYGMGGDDDIRTGIMMGATTSNGVGAAILHHHNSHGDGNVAAVGGINGASGPEIESSPHTTTNVDEMFMEMTNEDPDGQDDDHEEQQHVNIGRNNVGGGGGDVVAGVGMLGVDSSLPPSSILEHHTSQASEALELIGGVVEAGEGVTNGVDVGGPDDDANGHDQQAFDEFLNGGNA